MSQRLTDVPFGLWWLLSGCQLAFCEGVISLAPARLTHNGRVSRIQLRIHGTAAVNTQYPHIPVLGDCAFAGCPRLYTLGQVGMEDGPACGRGEGWAVTWASTRRGRRWQGLVQPRQGHLLCGRLGRVVWRAVADAQHISALVVTLLG